MATYYSMSPLKVMGIDIYFVSLPDGGKIAIAEAMGHQIARTTAETEALGPFNIEEFAAFARKDIAERVLKGE